MEYVNNTNTIVKVVIAFLLLLCLIDADYGFYLLIRAMVSVGFAFLTYRYYQTGEKANTIIYLCLLVIFQPLFRIGLEREIWIIMDLVAAGFLLYQSFIPRFFSKKSSAKIHVVSKNPSSSKPNNSIQNSVNRISEKW